MKLSFSVDVRLSDYFILKITTEISTKINMEGACYTFGCEYNFGWQRCNVARTFRDFKSNIRDSLKMAHRTRPKCRSHYFKCFPIWWVL